MDTLALLCNLHADGPATLQRLRRLGCESLVGLRRFAPTTLAGHLAWSERAAERFLREAELLHERAECEEGPEGRASEPFELESTLVQPLESEECLELESASPASGAPGADAEEAPAVEGVEAVLGAWRELDQQAPPSAPFDFVIPRPAPLPDLALRDGLFPGLVPDLVARFEGQGVRTLRDLVGAQELELARAAGLGFTRLKHFKFLAARELERLHRAAEAPPAARTFEPFTPGPCEPFETAGPFA